MASQPINIPLKLIIIGGRINRGEFTNLVKRFEKNIFKSKKGFYDATELMHFFKDAIDSLKLIKKAIDENPELAREFQLLSSEKKSIVAWKEACSSIQSIKYFLDGIEDEKISANSFVESFCNNRFYSFPNSKSTISFMGEILDFFSIQKLYLKPQFIGTIELGEIAKKLNLKHDKAGILLNVSDLKRVLKHLMQNKLSSNLLFDASAAKIYWQNPKQLRINADSNRLKLLDRMCSSFQGKCVEKLSS